MLPTLDMSLVLPCAALGVSLLHVALLLNKSLTASRGIRDTTLVTAERKFVSVTPALLGQALHGSTFAADEENAGAGEAAPEASTEVLITPESVMETDEERQERRKKERIQRETDALVRARDDGLMIKAQSKINVEDLTDDQVKDELRARGKKWKEETRDSEERIALLKKTRLESNIFNGFLWAATAVIVLLYINAGINYLWDITDPDAITETANAAAAAAGN